MDTMLILGDGALGRAVESAGLKWAQAGARTTCSDPRPRSPA